MTLYFTPEEETEFLREQRKVYFPSGFGFLNSHNGFRRGAIHLVIGNTSGGKSTLVRSLVRDILLYPNTSAQLALWLSEETVTEYRAMLSKGLPSSEALLRSEAYSEMDNPKAGAMVLFEWLEMVKPDAFIFDNVTTSRFYMDKRPDAQAEFVTKIKEATKRLNIATILIAHTDSSVNQSQKGYIELNMVRGSKQLANMAEFAYILQRFQIKNDFFATVRIVKHRSQDIVHDLYLLTYDKRFSSYTGDKDIDHAKFKTAYDQRNRL
jgi:KaiC/GvpD/RAD55 family RecA-like ATPase